MILFEILEFLFFILNLILFFLHFQCMSIKHMLKIGVLLF